MSISLSQQLALNDQYRATWEYFLRWALDILSYLTSVLMVPAKNMIHLFRYVRMLIGPAMGIEALKCISYPTQAWSASYHLYSPILSFVMSH
nr:hypothetical protein Iba_chr06cCG14360 [Ipomoea batatas]GMD51785.1 hypothetical protein Iba_chr11bCG5630 [Ipomoea batatas]GMD63119.1 hypothetical protein Iba_chr12bCG11860 [Ipomoea batatas]